MKTLVKPHLEQFRYASGAPRDHRSTELRYMWTEK